MWATAADSKTRGVSPLIILDHHLRALRQVGSAEFYYPSLGRKLRGAVAVSSIKCVLSAKLPSRRWDGSTIQGELRRPTVTFAELGRSSARSRKLC